MVGSIVGPPGAGKTTQGDFIEDNFCICQFELGSFQRNTVSEGKEAGELVKKYDSYKPDDKSNEYLKV